MAGLTALATGAATAGSASSRTLGSITPTRGRIVLCFVYAVNTGNFPAFTSISGAGLTWAQLWPTDTHTNISDGNKMALGSFIGIGTAPSAGSPVVVGTDMTTALQYSIFEIDSLKQSGGAGVDAKVQNDADDGSGSAWAGPISLAAFERAEHISIAAAAAWNTASNISPPTDFTQIHENIYSGHSAQSRLITAWRNANDTSFIFTGGGLDITKAGTIVQGGELATNRAFVYDGAVWQPAAGLLVYDGAAWQYAKPRVRTASAWTP